MDKRRKGKTQRIKQSRQRSKHAPERQGKSSVITTNAAECTTKPKPKPKPKPKSERANPNPVPPTHRDGEPANDDDEVVLHIRLGPLHHLRLLPLPPIAVPSGTPRHIFAAAAAAEHPPLCEGCKLEKE